MDSKTSTLLMAIRQALIIALGAIEDFLIDNELLAGRSIKPKRSK